MPPIVKLSKLVSEIDDKIKNVFTNNTFWIKAELSGVKKFPNKSICYFDLIEKDENEETVIRCFVGKENYFFIKEFEKETGKEFKLGIQITCRVKISFYKSKSQLQFEVVEIDSDFELGKFELQKQKVIEELSKNKSIIINKKGIIETWNNSIKIPKVIQKIALITAANSDGQRDFKSVLKKNDLGYDFQIFEFLTSMQGKNTSLNIIEKLNEIKEMNFDIVVITRGGGADTDFLEFNDYNLSQVVAKYKTPIFTGIGHDRNEFIIDIVANKKFRTPLEVSYFIIDHNRNFEMEILNFHNKIKMAAHKKISITSERLSNYKFIVKYLDPETILKKGFAIIRSNEKIVINPEKINLNSEIQITLKNQILYSNVLKKTDYER